MNFLKFLFTNFFTLFFTIAFTPIAISIVSKIKTGHWFKYFIDYSIELIAIGSSVLIIWILTIIYYKISGIIRERNDNSLGIAQTPEWGWKYVEKELYKKVIWSPRFPLFWGPEDEFKLNKYVLDYLEIEFPPRCPLCKTELIENKTIFGWYKWKCINCGFVTRKIYNFSYHANQLERIVRRKIEKQLNLNI